MARWNSNEFPEPDPNDKDRIRQFIRLKYVEKRWVARGNNQRPQQQSQSHQQSHSVRTEPLTNVLGNFTIAFYYKKNINFNSNTTLFVTLKTKRYLKLIYLKNQKTIYYHCYPKITSPVTTIFFTHKDHHSLLILITINSLLFLKIIYNNA